jgi:hypothetical protein
MPHHPVPHRWCSPRRVRLSAGLTLALLVPLAAAPTPLRIGFVDQSLPGATSARNAAALAFAQTQGTALRVRALPDGSWQTADNAVAAPEQFDVLWFHEADQATRADLSEAAVAELRGYVTGGGCVLLSGAAGQLAHLVGAESTPPRTLEATDTPFVSGLRAKPEWRQHPAFAGLDPSQDIPLTTRGCIALADFYGTDGPHGDLLAEGNASLGERPLVEYRLGAGRIILVGWRLADFSTAADAYRPNLERLFVNLLQHLAAANTNHATLCAGAGKGSYQRRLGVPFLATATPGEITVSGSASQTLVLLRTDPGTGTSHPADGAFVEETPFAGGSLTVTALAATLCQRRTPAADFVVDLQTRQAEFDRHDAELGAGLRVLKPAVAVSAGPLAPSQLPDVDQSVILGRSAFMAPGEGLGKVDPVYEPIADGGFSIRNGPRRENRPIVHGQNRVWTGDRPVFRLDTVTGNGCYAEDRAFPLWPRPNAEVGNVNPCLGTLRLGVPAAAGTVLWLDDVATVATEFRPGYTTYEIRAPDEAWVARLAVAPTVGGHGLVCQVEFDREVPLLWQFGSIWWQAADVRDNRVEFRNGYACLTDPGLPNGQVLAGWDGTGSGHALAAPSGQTAEFASTRPQRLYHVVIAWGVSSVDPARLAATLARLDTPNANAWPAARDQLKLAWRTAYIDAALAPEPRLQNWLQAPAAQIEGKRQWWDQRRAEFQIRTPDVHLNALINWARCVSEYHRQGPGLVLGGQIWQMYSHISTGWNGKLWGGDAAAIADNLRLYAAMQDPSGFIRWISPSLVAFNAENNTPYWVDQVWQYYAWTGDRQFLQDLWPAVQRACAWVQNTNDADGDGLFRDAYEYWNCDSNGKGPKAAAPSATAWAMFDRASRIAATVGEAAEATRFGDLASKTRAAVFRELWREDAGRLGSIGADGLWRGHPQIWEEYLAANAGLLDADQSRRAMRWIAGHYGFEPQPGVNLLMCSDWWPVRWSVQWVPTGDTCLAALAGLRSGDADLWWPYLRSVVLSAFRSDFPGINMGISNHGAGGGDREDVDSDDPHVQVAVRGLFGIEPALHEGRLRVQPSLPSAWPEASLRLPGLEVDYRRTGSQATLRVRTARPTVKALRAHPTGPEMVTPAETESIVTLDLGPPPAPITPPVQPTILAHQQPPAAAPALSVAEVRQLVLVDLAGAYNQTVEEFGSTGYIFDHADQPAPLTSWWGNPSLRLPPGPRLVQTSHGVRFLTAGQPTMRATPAGRRALLVLSSWRPGPVPAAARLPIGVSCRRLWLLLAAYVHPMKNYLPNGEVFLRYADGRTDVVQLIPPFNLDAYFQHFSRSGVEVPFAQMGAFSAGWTPIDRGSARAHADALEIPCRADAVLDSLELRATCSEGIIGLAGLTLQVTP